MTKNKIINYLNKDLCGRCSNKDITIVFDIKDKILLIEKGA